MSTLARDEARRLFGDDFLDPEALVALLGSTVAAPEIPFAKDVAQAAQREGCLLIYRYFRGTKEIPDYYTRLAEMERAAES